MCPLESFQEDLCCKMKLLRNISFSILHVASPVHRMVVHSFSQSWQMLELALVLYWDLGVFSTLLNSGACYDTINTS